MSVDGNAVVAESDRPLSSPSEESIVDGGVMFAEISSIHGKKHRLYFDRSSRKFEFSLVGNDKDKITYRLEELLNVRTYHLPIKCGILQPSEDKEKKITVKTLFFYFVYRKDKHKWRVKEIPVLFATPTERDYWKDVIDVTLRDIVQRPRRLIVYINPFGGKGKAPKIYKQYVEPLFALAEIDVRVIYTEYANHAREHVEKVEEWCDLDGVVSVGGDGLFNEVLSGALNRMLQQENVDGNDTSVRMRTPHFRFGIIGAGSANSIVSTVHETDDYATSAVHIAIGSECSVDACTVHDRGRLVRISADAISYGWLGDVLRDSEAYRCLGPIRYQWSALRTTIRNPTYKGCVSFSLSANETSNPKERLPPCDQPCPHCGRVAADTGYDYHWHSSFTHVICCVIPCVTPFTPYGLAPFTGLGDGSLDLSMVPKISRFHNLQFMRKVAMYGGKGLYELDPTLNCYRVSKWSYMPDPDQDDPGVWNLDGEILEQPKDAPLEFRLHPRLISFFGRDAAVIRPSKRSIREALKGRKSSIVYR